MSNRDIIEDNGDSAIPEATKATIDNYVSKGWKPGSFVYAVLSNNLVGAVGRADLRNKAALTSIVGYVYNSIPSSCWGNEAKVEAHLKKFECKDE